MYIYSGKCKVGTVGQETALTDSFQESLSVGDIVLVSHIKNAVSPFLTMVVSDEFVSFIDGTVKIKKGKIEHFIMGIRDETQEFDSWEIKKIKNFQDVKLYRPYSIFNLYLKKG